MLLTGETPVLRGALAAPAGAGGAVTPDDPSWSIASPVARLNLQPHLQRAFVREAPAGTSYARPQLGQNTVEVSSEDMASLSNIGLHESQDQRTGWHVYAS
jgi:hypothetical protein